MIMVIDIGMSPLASICARAPDWNQGASQMVPGTPCAGLSVRLCCAMASSASPHSSNGNSIAPSLLKAGFGP